MNTRPSGLLNPFDTLPEARGTEGRRARRWATTAATTAAIGAVVGGAASGTAFAETPGSDDCLGEIISFGQAWEKATGSPYVGDIPSGQEARLTACLDARDASGGSGGHDDFPGFRTSPEMIEAQRAMEESRRLADEQAARVLAAGRAEIERVRQVLREDDARRAVDRAARIAALGRTLPSPAITPGSRFNVGPGAAPSIDPIPLGGTLGPAVRIDPSWIQPNGMVRVPAETILRAGASG